MRKIREEPIQKNSETFAAKSTQLRTKDMIILANTKIQAPKAGESSCNVAHSVPIPVLPKNMNKIV